MTRYLTVIELKKCEPDRLKYEFLIKDYVEKLFRKIHGDIRSQLLYAGDCVESEGLKIISIYDDTLITVHTTRDNNCVYVDISSAKNFDASKITVFSQEFFIADGVTRRTMIR